MEKESKRRHMVAIDQSYQLDALCSPFSWAAFEKQTHPLVDSEKGAHDALSLFEGLKSLMFLRSGSPQSGAGGAPWNAFISDAHCV